MIDRIEDQVKDICDAVDDTTIELDIVEISKVVRGLGRYVEARRRMIVQIRLNGESILRSQAECVEANSDMEDLFE